MAGFRTLEAYEWFSSHVHESCVDCVKCHNFTCSGADAARCAAYREALVALREKLVNSGRGGVVSNG